MLVCDQPLCFGVEGTGRGVCAFSVDVQLSGDAEQGEGEGRNPSGVVVAVLQLWM